MSGSGHSHMANVMIASAQSVSKVFVIGAVGFFAVQYPKSAPLLPYQAVGTIAHFCFHTLVLALVYSSTAVSVNKESVGNYWFVFVSSLFVVAISYTVATVLGWCFFSFDSNNNSNNTTDTTDEEQNHKPLSSTTVTTLPTTALPTTATESASAESAAKEKFIMSSEDFTALRISATFSNIVTLPILLYPSLCEYAVVYNSFTSATSSAHSRTAQCTAEANTMIFVYSFGWSLVFWSWGYHQLETAATKVADRARQQQEKQGQLLLLNNHSSSRQQQQQGSHTDVQRTQESFSVDEEGEERTIDLEPRDSGHQNVDPVVLMTSAAAPVDTAPVSCVKPAAESKFMYVLRLLWVASKRTFTSPGFVALILGIITGFIPPLRDALFQPGGAIRFLGDALQTLGQAATCLSTIIVAASLVPQNAKQDKEQGNSIKGEEHEGSSQPLPEQHQDQTPHTDPAATNGTQGECGPNPITIEPSFAPNRRLTLFQRAATTSRQMISPNKKSSAPPSPEVLLKRKRQRTVFLWFALTRFVIAPAIVVALFYGLEPFLRGIPPLSKLVVVINAAMPGALIVVVVLKAQPLFADTAAMIASVYLTTYLVSILTTTAWIAIGLWVAEP